MERRPVTHPHSDSSSSAPVRPGDWVAQKYRVDAILGQGAMGVVVSATHTELQQQFAIKFMLGSASRDPALVERFVREARASAQLRSEHVARVMDVGKLDNGTPYMIMEFLQGRDLGAELEQRGKLPVKEAADYLLQACEALSEAHALGIVHRDLKPSNFFLAQRRDGSRQLKILDFGISKVSDGVSEGGLTSTRAMMGSPLYMAPEQIRNAKDADARSDVWSLGVTLYELLTGRTPFEAEQVGGLLAAIIADRHPSVRSLDPGIAPELDALVDRCLEKERPSRLQSVVELARGLRPFASTTGKVVADRISYSGLHSVGQTTALPPSSDPALAPAQTGFGAAMTKAPMVRTALPWFGGAVAVAIAAAAGFWFSRATVERTMEEAPLEENQPELAADGDGKGADGDHAASDRVASPTFQPSVGEAVSPTTAVPAQAGASTSPPLASSRPTEALLAPSEPPPTKRASQPAIRTAPATEPEKTKPSRPAPQATQRKPAQTHAAKVESQPAPPEASPPASASTNPLAGRK